MKVATDRVDWWVDGVHVAGHERHIPAPYARLDCKLIIDNDTGATSTNFAFDSITIINHNEVRATVEQPDASKLQMMPARTPYATETTVAAAAASTALLAANVQRVGFTIRNDSDRDMYVSYGGTAAATSPDLIRAGATGEDTSRYTGAVNGYWLTGVTGNARIREYVA